MKSHSLNETKHPSIILDAKHNIIEYNPAFLDVFGNSITKIKGKKCFKLLHGTSGPPKGCPMHDVLVYGDFQTREILMETLNNKYLVSCMPIRDDDGFITKIMHVLQKLQEQV